MRRWLPIGLLAVSLYGTWRLISLLIDGVPTVQKQDGWFWPIRPGEGGLVLLAVAIFCLAIAVRVVASPSPRRLGAKIAMLIATGWMLQQGLAFVDHRGIDMMRDRMLRTGHAEFAVTASRKLPILPLVRNYEQMVKAPDQVYARSKPPGQLLFYIASANVAQVVMPRLWDPPMPVRPDVKNLRHWRLANFATLFFPLFSMLPVIPLAFLGALFLGRTRALWPSLGFILVPQAQLVTMHLDQVIYPFLAVSIWALAAKAASSPRAVAWRWWIAAATLVWFSVYVTFSLLPGLVPLAFVVGLVPGESFKERARAVVEGAGIALATVLAWMGLFRVALNYDMLIAYRRGFENHVGWNHWKDSMQWPAAKLDLSELAYWIGVPFVVLFLLQCVVGLRKPLEAITIFAVSTLAAILFTAIMGKTIGEIARLWLFFTPAMVLAGMYVLSQMVHPKKALVPLQLLAAGQLAWMMALKTMEDFR